MPSNDSRHADVGIFVGSKREYEYWRVIITYIDGGTTGHRVFKDRNKAERWAERQRKSRVVKFVRVESFTSQPLSWRDSA